MKSFLNGVESDTDSFRASVVRVVGYALYNAWVLCTFSNTLLFVMPEDKRSLLYFNYLVSLAVLCITLGVFFRFVKHPDKFVLSRRCIFFAGIFLPLATSFLPFSDMDSLSGVVLLTTSAVGTGISSGMLFLAWSRLYCDCGAKTLVSEMALAWAAAGCIGILVSTMPSIVAIVAVIVMGFFSALLLRWSVCHRPRRLETTRVKDRADSFNPSFKRGIIACSCIALIAGFSDVISGFRFIPIPEGYEIRLALGTFALGAASFAAVRFASKSYVRVLWRLSLLVIATGCLLMQFATELDGLSDVLICCGYQVPLMVLLCGICADVSNSYDIPATKVFGTAFFWLYLGNVFGSCLAHVLVFVVGLSVADLTLMSLIASLAVIAIAFLLFTEGDLIGVAVGEFAGIGGGREFFGGGVGASESALLEGEELSVSVRASVDASDEDCSTGCGLAMVGRLVVEYGLTPRESEVLSFLLRGRSLSFIQGALYISQGTANTHLRHIYRKMGVHSRQELFDLVEREQKRELENSRI